MATKGGESASFIAQEPRWTRLADDLQRLATGLLSLTKMNVWTQRERNARCSHSLWIFSRNLRPLCGLCKRHLLQFKINDLINKKLQCFCWAVLVLFKSNYYATAIYKNVGKVQLDSNTLQFTSIASFNFDHIVFWGDKWIFQAQWKFPTVWYKCVIKNK